MNITVARATSGRSRRALRVNNNLAGFPAQLDVHSDREEADDALASRQDLSLSLDDALAHAADGEPLPPFFSFDTPATAPNSMNERTEEAFQMLAARVADLEREEIQILESNKRLLEDLKVMVQGRN